MILQFYGAAAEVTGSCHLLQVGGRTVLLDCGLIQGSRKDEARNAEPFPFDVSRVDAVVLSHAHLDHSGRLPLLVKRGYRGPIFAQEASCELVAILLADAAQLAERDAEYESRKTAKRVKPLYTLVEGERVMGLLRGVKYREIFEPVPGVRVRFRDAGHILGSCTVEIWLGEGKLERKIVFSGDLGQYDTPILRDPEPIDRADLVLMESTYGDRRHRDRRDTVAELGGILSAADANRGNVLIPAFAVGRSQEVLFELGRHYDEWNLARFQVFLDSPMAIEASKVYWDYSELYDAEAKALSERNRGLPLLPNLTLSRQPEQSMAINRMRSGAIVIAGSGMCNGGRIVHHLKHHLGREETQLIIVGYQARGSLGRRIVDGAQSVRIHGRDVPVRARVHTIGGLSAHGDQDDMARWYECMEGRPPVWLVHGEPDSQQGFRDYLSERCGARVTLPRPGDAVDLGTLQPG
ncbi:MAG: MBL fold metallo-hydrolase [Xanthomonadales bacterium]|nr:MBL fold metallo-hydrolase [Xanthomonadales bacterium]